jgi:hypothetical protein
MLTAKTRSVTLSLDVECEQAYSFGFARTFGGVHGDT